MQFIKCTFWGASVPEIPVAKFYYCKFVYVDKLPAPEQCQGCVVVDADGNETPYGTLPHAVDNGDGTGSLKGKLVGMGF